MSVPRPLTSAWTPHGGAAVGALSLMVLLLVLSAGPTREGGPPPPVRPTLTHAMALHAGAAGGGRERVAVIRGSRQSMGVVGPKGALGAPGSRAMLKLALLLLPLLAAIGLGTQLHRDRGNRRKSEQRIMAFVATACHELRTPLTAISGYVQLARLGGLADVEKFDLVMDRMADETRRMSALLDELMLLARLDLGQPLRSEPVNLAQLCREVVADAQACSPHHPIRLTILPGTHAVVGDRDRLYQAVANLLANVRHHTPGGTRTALGLGTEDGFRVIEVIDDGPGIPVELRHSAFERFVHGGKAATRPPVADTGGGNGLGLSVVAAIVTAHGGTVSLEPGRRGAWFRIRLPA
ncbi:HAMP domain-containing sensor histidine kinase [Streptomyces sp. SS7]|uniref:sensor histidine kinase n=1 Tax=Streptomyces sp. SS7 TaxID=3108485 RepID=UPI0030ED0C05